MGLRTLRKEWSYGYLHATALAVDFLELTVLAGKTLLGKPSSYQKI